jgi:hypothetical protein
MIRRVQTKHKVRPHGMDPTTELLADGDVELVAVESGQRRDVLVKREGFSDYLVYDGNIAGIEVEQILPEFEPVLAQLADSKLGELVCDQCGKAFESQRALKGHQSRVHR